ncbi:MAG: alpha-amylase family glycosyl hydrolase, partial [Lentisphaeria bacterium]|nr:alpha-amylase family glycosyl hydrolase [Lentisphaeria bacterium]
MSKPIPSLLPETIAAALGGDLPDPIPEDIRARQVRPSPAWFTHGIIYQVQPRAFTPEGTLAAATARLPEVAALGTTIVYLWPVTVADDDLNPDYWSPRQKACNLNNPRNPYRTKDYYHVDPEYGSDQDLKDFIRAAHRLGLRVMLDLVYLHCGPDPVFLAEHPDFVLRHPDGSMRNAAWCFPGLNFANPGLREYLWRNMEMWIRDYDADGFRCDVSARVAQEFWEEGRRRIERIKPDVAMLAEARRSSDQDFAFDADYGFDWLYRAVVPVVGGSPAILFRDMWTWQYMTRP